MATAYETQLLEKKFRPNIVIRFLSTYFAMEQPDSGLSISYPYSRVVQSAVVSPTQIDLRRSSQTIASYSMKLVDRDGIITKLVKDRADALVGQTVEIWVGRRTGNFAFSNYFKLPDTRIKKIEHSENAYYISMADSTERLNKPIFTLQGKLEDAVIETTTIFTLVDGVTDFPSAGTAKIEDEFFSWTAKDESLRQLKNIVRGELGSFPAAHMSGVDIYRAHDTTDNPINILLKLLISGGGGGPYDVYPEGLGISPSLIDVTAIETIRDDLFFGDQFQFTFYNIDNALNYIEKEILQACNIRLIVSNASKISIAVLDQALFSDAANTIDEDTITQYPKWSVDDNDILNVIRIDWDFNEVTGNYQRSTQFSDSDSILNNGQRPTYTMQFKGIHESLSGDSIVSKIAQRFLARFSTPTPEITVKTQIDKHLLEVGSKAVVSSSEIPTADGSLQFVNTLEVISRGINFETCDVSFKLAFTSYTGIRQCFIAPSDLFTSVIDQKTFTVPAGRGAYYMVGWKMRLWDVNAVDYAPDAVNTIADITDDTITFENDFVTPITANLFRMKFANYDEVVDDQQRYCFISNMGNDFADGKSSYKIGF